MKTYQFPVLVERDEDGWYIGTVPDLKGCHTQARSLDELDKRLKEAIRLCLETDKGAAPRNKFIGVHQVELSI